MSKILPVIITVALSVQWGYSQTIKAWISAADSAFVEKEYYTAFKYYEIALEYDSTRTDLWFRYGNAARQFNAYPSAALAYEQVRAAETAPERPEATFWLAVVRQRQGKYITARNLFSQFLDQYEQESPNLAQKARHHLEEISFALDRIRQSEIDSAWHFGPEINTPYSEFGAVYQGDTLYYSSFRFPYKKDLHNPSRPYIKVLTSINGQEGTLLADSFNIEGKHTANTTFSKDGSEVVFTLCEYTEDGGKVRCDLYRRSRLKGGSWGAPQMLNINAEGFTSTQPALAHHPETEQTMLFFASDREGGQGGLDLWISLRNEDGSFQAPENLSALNTSGDDATPFFHQLSQQLFFSSDGRIGLGALDIYASRKDDDGNWLTPEHLDYPVNTSYNDIYYALNSKGSLATFSSDRASGTYIDANVEACCYDIFQIDIDIQIDLLVRTFNKLDSSILEGATVYLYEIQPDGREVVVDSITNPLGHEFNFPLERYKNYRIEAKREGFAPVGLPLDLRNAEFARSTTIERDLFMEPSQIDLQALTFDAEDQSPLAGTTVKLMELVDGEPRLVAEKTNPDSNDFLFPLELNKTYIITADKPGYGPVTDTLRFTPQDIVRLGPRPRVELYLERINFDDFLPLALYFDNDRPDPRSTSVSTGKTYEETYEIYYSRKEEFVERFTEGLSQNDSFLLAQNYENFFDREVQGGYTDLNNFSEKLLPYLEQGNTITIKLKGFASPRASSDYNLILSKRRVRSVANHFRRYQEGELMPYLKNGQLVIEQEAFGESTAQGVPDDIKDEKNSIYSLLASVERRVEIVEVTTGQAENKDLTSPDK